DEARIGEQGDEVAERRMALLVGKGIDEQPANRQDDDRRQQDDDTPQHDAREVEPHTLKYRAYWALIWSACFSTSAGSSRHVLICDRAGRPAFALARLLAGYWPLRSTMNCWPSGDMIQLTSSRAAFGLGADLKMAIGLLICGVPSTGSTTSTGEPR